MLKKLFYNRKLVVSAFVVLIVLLTLVALVPVFYSVFLGSGVKTEPINKEKTKPASTALEGKWEVVTGNPFNHTGAGFTFYEILPGEKRFTSATTTAVSGQASVIGETLSEATVTVDLTKLGSDSQVRDQNMKDKLFETHSFPEATFILTQPVDLSALPADGSTATIPVTGDLTIKGKTQAVEDELEFVRDGDTVLVGGDIAINRLDYDIITPDFIAAQIAEEGDINIRLTFAKA
ncbi:MAG: YceI family protein [Corynebacterium sp.]|nr:YceI family protein [Corynebacterium sp.]